MYQCQTIRTSAPAIYIDKVWITKTTQLQVIYYYINCFKILILNGYSIMEEECWVEFESELDTGVEHLDSNTYAPHRRKVHNALQIKKKHTFVISDASLSLQF